MIYITDLFLQAVHETVIILAGLCEMGKPKLESLFIVL